MGTLRLSVIGTYFALAMFSNTTNAADVLPLEGRLPATLGGMDFQAYYDPNLNVTWSATDGIYTEALGSAAPIAELWLENFEINGITGWRFPNLDVNGDGTVVDCRLGAGADCVDNEFGFLYWEQGITILNPSPFDISYPSEIGHWASNVSVSFLTGFSFSGGVNLGNFREDPLKTWAVRSGDVGAIPVPATVWLFGSGLVGLFAAARRNR